MPTSQEVNQREYLYCVEYANGKGVVLKRHYLMATSAEDAFLREDDDPIAVVFTKEGEKMEQDGYEDSCAYIVDRQELKELMDKYKGWLDKARENMDDLTMTLIRLEEVED